MGEMSKILVVDDESMICNVVMDCLQEWPGVEVDCALSGKLAAQKLRAVHYDLVLIDGMLPEISGLALAEIAANENTPVLLLSGHPDLNQTLQTFGYPYLPKPFSLTQLLAESKRVTAEASENIRCVKAAAARMKANTEALKAAVAESGPCV
jgi:DNA-binding response OmpR family regulator